MKSRLLGLLCLTLLAGCNKQGTFAGGGGVFMTRSVCPQVGIPAGTGDVTLFDPAGNTSAAAIDVVATITNLRANCNEAGAEIISTASFDVVAIRRDAGAARQVVLPYYNVLMQGGTEVAAKRIGYVALNFAAGSQRAQTSGQAIGRVSRSAVTLPEDIRRELTRERKPGDADAAVDPLSNPTVRDAVARATFEQLIGFQLTQDQLRYNATR